MMNNNRWNTNTILTLYGLLLLIGAILAFYFIGSNLTNQTGYFYLAGGLALLIIIIAIIYTILVAKGKIIRSEPDYRQLFIFGLVFLPIGIGSDNQVFLILSLSFMAIGLVNKKKWRPTPKWSEMTPAKRNFKIALIIILGLMVILSFVAWYLSQRT